MRAAGFDHSVPSKSLRRFTGSLKFFPLCIIVVATFGFASTAFAKPPSIDSTIWVKGASWASVTNDIDHRKCKSTDFPGFEDSPPTADFIQALGLSFLVNDEGVIPLSKSFYSETRQKWSSLPLCKHQPPPKTANAASTTPAHARHERALERMIEQNQRDYFIGPNVGVFVSGGTGPNNFTERDADTGAFLEQNSLGASARFGGGGHIGFVIPFITQPVPSAPGIGPVFIEPFVEIWEPNEKSEIDFSNGASLSVNRDFAATFGFNVGPTFIIPQGVISPYVTIGEGVQNETIHFDFMPTASSASKTALGFTTGFGLAVIPNGVQVAGVPVTFSLEYRHTALQTVTVNRPGASPTTNFDIKGSSDEVRVGAKLFIFGGFGGPQPIRLPAGR